MRPQAIPYSQRKQAIVPRERNILREYVSREEAIKIFKETNKSFNSDPPKLTTQRASILEEMAIANVGDRVRIEALANDERVINALVHKTVEGIFLGYKYIPGRGFIIGVKEEGTNKTFTFCIDSWGFDYSKIPHNQKHVSKPTSDLAILSSTSIHTSGHALLTIRKIKLEPTRFHHPPPAIQGRTLTREEVRTLKKMLDSSPK